MNEQIDDLLILGISFTQQQLEDLREAINVSLARFENSPVDPNEALTYRLVKIKDRVEYMIARKQEYK
jgi:hypothetical protein